MLQRYLLVIATALLSTLVPLRGWSQDVRGGTISVTAPWIPEPPATAKVAGGFLSITNSGKATDRLVGASTDAAGTIEIHEMHLVNGVMMMSHLNPGITIKEQTTVVLKPFSHHLMLMDLKRPLKAGETVKGLLVFENAGSVEVNFVVEPLGSSGPRGNAPHLKCKKGYVLTDDQKCVKEN